MDLIISRNSKKNKNYLYDLIDQVLKSGGIAYLLVPEQFTLSTEIEIFDYLGLESSINLKIKSFRTIVEEIFESIGNQNRDFLDENSQRLLMRIALDRVKDDLEVFSQSIEENGFIDLLISLFNDFKSNLVQPENLLSLDGENMDEELKKKLSDIYLIFTSYQDLLGDKKLDGMDRFKLAVDQVDRMDNFREVTFFYDQFLSMSKQEIEMLKGLDRMGKDSFMTMTMDQALVDYLGDDRYMARVDDGEVFDLSRSFLGALEELRPSYIFLEDDRHENEDIDYLLRNIFSYKLPKPRKAESIKLERYKNTYEEVEELVISIKKDVIEKKLRYRDIAVITTAPSEYFKLLKREFAANDIPYFLDTNRNLLENPIAKLIQASLDLLVSSFKWDSIISFLKAGFFEFEQDELNIFQNYLQERKIRGKMIFEDRYFKSPQKIEDGREEKDSISREAYREEDEEKLEIVLKIRQAFLEIISSLDYEVEDLLDINKKEDRVENFAKKVYALVGNDLVLARLKAYEDRLDEAGFNHILDENRMVWNSFMDILDNFVDLVDKKLSFKTFNDYLKDMVDQIRIGIIPPSQDQVIIGEIDRSRLMDIKKLYIVGLSSNYFPRSNKEADIFFESEKDLLADKGIKITKTNDFARKRNMLSFYNLLNKSSRELVFSFSLVNSDNESMTASSIVEYIALATGQLRQDDKGRLVPVYRDVSFRDSVYSKTKLNYYIPTTLKTMSEGSYVKEEEKEFVKRVKNSLEGKKDYDKILSSYRTALEDMKKNYKLSNKAVDKLYGKKKTLSISQIEAYQTCPYRHFISYGIRPREKDDYDINNLDIGNLAHYVADSYVERLSQDQDADKRQIIDESFEKSKKFYLDDYKLEDSRNKYFLKRTKDSLEFSLDNIGRQLEISRPDKIYSEVAYGLNKQFPPIFIRTKDRDFMIQGVIDRVDEFDLDGKRYFRIIDYKTGNKVFDIGMVMHGLDVQLVLYLYSVKSRDQRSKPLGAFYIKLNDAYKSDKENLEDIKEDIRRYYRMDGFVTDDTRVLGQVDKSFNPDETNNSDVIYLRGRRKGFENKRNILNDQDMDRLFKYVLDLSKNAIEAIYGGDAKVYPYMDHNDHTPCVYCNYRGICKFNKDYYRHLRKYNWAQAKEELEDKDD